MLENYLKNDQFSRITLIRNLYDGFHPSAARAV